MGTSTELALTTRPDLVAIAAIRDGYYHQVKHFVTWAMQTGNTLDEQGIRSYFAHLRTLPYTANTVRNKRTAVKRRVRQIYHDSPVEERMKIDRVLADLDHDDPAPKINSVEITKDKCLDNGEYRHLLEHCRSDRQRAFIRFLNTTGCRVSEMTGIRLDQAEDIGTAMKIRVLGKGRKERFVRIPHDLYTFIKETFNGSTYLFETSNGKSYGRVYVSSQIARIGHLIDRKIGAHTMRHSFATRKVQQLPGKLDAVSKYLGHSTPSITLAMYCHTSITDVELFNEIEESD